MRNVPRRHRAGSSADCPAAFDDQRLERGERQRDDAARASCPRPRAVCTDDVAAEPVGASRTTSRPMPRPETSVTASEVLRPPLSSSRSELAGVRAARHRRSDALPAQRRASHGFEVDAAAVVAQRNDDASAAPRDLERRRVPPAGLPAARAQLRARCRARPRCARSAPARSCTASSTWASSRTSPPLASNVDALAERLRGVARRPLERGEQRARPAPAAAAPAARAPGAARARCWSTARSEAALDAPRCAAQLLGQRCALATACAPAASSADRALARRVRELARQAARPDGRARSSARRRCRRIARARRASLRHSVEQRVDLGDLGADRAQSLLAPDGRRLCPLRRSGGACSDAEPAIASTMLEHARRSCSPVPTRPPVSRNGASASSIACARSAISALLDDARRALERVREAQQARHQLRAGVALLELEHALAELVEQLARLDPEVLVGILRHRLQAARCAPARAAADPATAPPAATPSAASGRSSPRSPSPPARRWRSRG